jgi:hypothetical protein
MLTERNDSDSKKDDMEIVAHFDSIIQRHKPGSNQSNTGTTTPINAPQIMEERSALFEKLAALNREAHERMDREFFAVDQTPTGRNERKKKAPKRLQPAGFEAVVWPHHPLYWMQLNDIDDGPPPPSKH